MDVRMLGDGRPFMIEIVNPLMIPDDDGVYAEIQQKINASTDLIRVTEIQRISKYVTTITIQHHNHYKSFEALINISPGKTVIKSKKAKKPKRKLIGT